MVNRTTGQPKCIVHSVGGVVLGGGKEGRLHRDVNHRSTCLQYTTTGMLALPLGFVTMDLCGFRLRRSDLGWIMYLASVQTLLFGAKLVMYDGSPFYPRVDTFLRIAGEHKYVYPPPQSSQLPL